ncbi:MAG: hypothetical protein GY953_24675 [bacterium]|nr:hypothetical protein [bacterium]
MTRSFRVTLAVCLIVSGGPSRAADVDRPDQRPKLLIRIYDYAAIPDSMLERAAERSTQIFRRAGIALEWRRCQTSMEDPRPGDPACQTPVGPADFIVRVLTEKMARRVGRRDECVGYAIHTKSGLGSIAGVYNHRLLELERQTNAPKHAILGIFLAHEIGHLLLSGGGHSREGVMRGWWGPEVMVRAAYGRVDFSRTQVRQMRKNAERRVGAAGGLAEVD